VKKDSKPFAARRGINAFAHALPETGNQFSGASFQGLRRVTGLSRAWPGRQGSLAFEIAPVSAISL
jgi:hypothetical protein